MATLKDVAKLACVDVSTVSRALNNTSYVHPDTKKKIYAAAKELGYRPNVMAKALRQGRAHTIGVVVPRLQFAIFSELLQGIQEAARKLNYETLICVTDDDPKKEADCLNRLRNGFVDGIIIAATGRNGHLLRDIKASGIAVLQLIRKQDPKISSVVADYEGCGYEAVKYLYGIGCREIGIIAGSQHLAPYKGRYSGYQKGIQKFGLSENTSECDYMVNSFEYGYECAAQLLDHNYDLDAIIACLDVQGLGASRLLKERNISQHEVKLVSLTGHSIGKMLQTSMTSMELPACGMGTRAAELIIDEIEHHSEENIGIQHVMFQAELVERESTTL